MKKEHLAAKVFKDLTWHLTGKENELFLTFDDGPTPEVTPWVLSLLKEFDAKATFFCIGGKVEKDPGIYNQIIDEGHSVGNHGYLHMNGWRTGTEKYVKNAHHAANFINSNLFRPPYGRIRPKQISALKKDFRIVMWDILAEDYNKKMSGEKSFQNILSYAESGSIIVLHDNLQSEEVLRYVLPRLLEHFTSQGFTFNPIEYQELK